MKRHCGTYMRLNGVTYTWRDAFGFPIGLVRQRFCAVCGKIRREFKAGWEAT